MAVALGTGTASASQGGDGDSQPGAETMEDEPTEASDNGECTVVALGGVMVSVSVFNIS